MAPKTSAGTRQTKPRKPARGYPSDVSDDEWAFVAPYLTLMREDAPQREHSLREVFNGLRYAVRAGEAYAEAAYLNGRAEQALVQLDILRKRDDVDYYARARIDARIAAITPVVLELRRQGIRDEDLGRR